VIIQGVMRQLFVPYSGSSPAPLKIKGHKLILVAREPEVIEPNLDLLGADHLIEMVSASDSEEAVNMSILAERYDSGVVILPEQVMLEDVIRSLEADLPWIH
jgi:hypothetical protein